MNIIDVVRKGGIIVYPADTIWGIGGDATNEKLIKRIIEIKQRPPEKGFIVLVSDYDMLLDIVGDIPPQAVEVIQKSVRPTTIIYPSFKNLPALAGAPDGSIAIRMVKKGFAKNLIETIRLPLISTSANISGQPAPLHFDEISKEILSQADYVVNLHRKKIASKPSRILKILPGGNLKLIRE
jgi:L-threonylcarbamoyladenylate synthase